MRVRRTNLASISVAVVLHQADLGSRSSGDDSWHTSGQDSEAGRVQLTRFPHAVGKALGLGGANWGGPGSRGQPASSGEDVWLHVEGVRRWLRA